MLGKIFQASGKDGITDLEAEINEWCSTASGIEHVETAMCQVGTAESGERFQHYVVSVWYT